MQTISEWYDKQVQKREVKRLKNRQLMGSYFTQRAKLMKTKIANEDTFKFQQDQLRAGLGKEKYKEFEKFSEGKIDIEDFKNRFPYTWAENYGKVRQNLLEQWQTHTKEIETKEANVTDFEFLHEQLETRLGTEDYKKYIGYIEDEIDMEGLKEDFPLTWSKKYRTLTEGLLERWQIDQEEAEQRNEIINRGYKSALMLQLPSEQAEEMKELLKTLPLEDAKALAAKLEGHAAGHTGGTASGGYDKDDIVDVINDIVEEVGESTYNKIYKPMFEENNWNVPFMEMKLANIKFEQDQGKDTDDWTELSDTKKQQLSYWEDEQNVIIDTEGLSPKQINERKINVYYGMIEIERLQKRLDYLENKSVEADFLDEKSEKIIKNIKKDIIKKRKEVSKYTLTDPQVDPEYRDFDTSFLPLSENYFATPKPTDDPLSDFYKPLDSIPINKKGDKPKDKSKWDKYKQ